MGNENVGGRASGLVSQKPTLFSGIPDENAASQTRE
jgi:hypothetical protein